MRTIAVGLVALMAPAFGHAQDLSNYLLIAAADPSALQQQMKTATREGFRFSAISGDASPAGGKEVIVVMRQDSSADGIEYRVVIAASTSAVGALQQASDDGFAYVAQTVFRNPIKGNQVAVLFERDPGAPLQPRSRYQLLVSNRISTMRTELDQAGHNGYRLLGLSVGKTLVGLNDIVAVLSRPVE
jgi:hypothetical protein